MFIYKSPIFRALFVGFILLSSNAYGQSLLFEEQNYGLSHNFPLEGSAQESIYEQDTLKAHSTSFKPSQIIVPSSLLLSGAIIHFGAHEAVDIAINQSTSKWKGDAPGQNIDDWLRFVPEAMHLGLSLVGAESVHNLRDRAIQAAWSLGSVSLLTYSLKYMIDSPRPDMSDNRSFPSGHASIAFAGAELVRMEYGWGWGAGAYTIATGVCVLRLYNNEHWFSDLVFGAGIGILSAHIGGWLLEPSKKLLGIKDNNIQLSAKLDPVSGLVCPSLALRF